MAEKKASISGRVVETKEGKIKGTVDQATEKK
ncbi:Uncharacterised protein [Staphylococcus muscae]|uniref:Uncharacterized protein n=1 Tax=Staphylococcus muscae TaxID=1294 RepID=A0A240C5V4_9STAP|nr:Uncharacterised protein [Staphylococcus muscae]